MSKNFLPSYDPTNRSPNERIFHAISFEVIATLICAPLFAWLMNQPIMAIGILTLIVAFIAMVWNGIYNYFFDRLFKTLVRGFKVRMLHALVFELGLIIITVPLAAWWLGISLWNAFLMDIGLILFFLPYAVIYNWSYDTLRYFLWCRRRGQIPH